MNYTKREEKYKDEFGANYKQRTKESLKAEISSASECCSNHSLPV